MLEQLSDLVRYCYRRAGESRRRAELAVDRQSADTFHQLERGWLRLAESCQLSQRVSTFLESGLNARYFPSRGAAPDWQSISTVPFDREIEVGTLEGNRYRIFAFAVYRRTTGWFADGIPGPLDLAPTHWRPLTRGSRWS
jgi:hypothetical protein